MKSRTLKDAHYDSLIVRLIALNTAFEAAKCGEAGANLAIDAEEGGAGFLPTMKKESEKV